MAKLEAMEYELLVEALRLHRGNSTEAARARGLTAWSAKPKSSNSIRSRSKPCGPRNPARSWTGSRHCSMPAPQPQGHRLCSQTVGASGRLFGRRPAAPGQQPGRKRPLALCRGPQKLAIFRPSARRRRLGRDLLPHRDRQGQRPGTVPLSAPPLRAFAGSNHRRPAQGLLPQHIDPQSLIIPA